MDMHEADHQATSEQTQGTVIIMRIKLIIDTILVKEE